ncbi:Lrp/AsnC family transcriptional regulator [Streptomyces iconiensis]|uniref:Lrp/AsnC family transcriptional regulator n=1 Tax=Streptomyces iconiensis TaxID=1384038 RepID=A0ABT6ZUN0_9ACTN|nr:Lrp/AsnC family transcriptional regulator [Streptomyces iconiensis]MDJ1132163.1 Lrp/AsnC family transcriptional regulator [Streptomyces iconiensis]
MKTYLDTTPPVCRELSEEDMALVHALQVNGRASFREIADALGVSDQTAARRWTRLRSAGKLRVLGLTDALRLGDSLWIVRTRCTPDAARSLGEAMARRTDTTWVNLTAGGTEITCSVRTRGPGQEEALLLQKLPRTPQVVDVSAHCVLHIFFGRDLGLINKRGPLTPAQVAELAFPAAPGPAADAAPPMALDEGDRHLLDLLARDGRAAPGELAAATGLSTSTVRRRITDLRTDGVLYFDVEYHPDVLQQEFRAALWLEIDPARLAEAGAALATHPGVAFAAATTGTTNLFASVDVPTAQRFYQYLTESVAALPGLRRTATAPLHRTLKGPGPYLPVRT